MAPKFHERAAAGRRASDRARLPRQARLRLRGAATARAPGPRPRFRPLGRSRLQRAPLRERRCWVPGGNNGRISAFRAGQPCPEAPPSGDKRSELRPWPGGWKNYGAGEGPRSPRPRSRRSPGSAGHPERPPPFPPAVLPVPIWLCFERGRLDLLFPEVALTRRPGAWGMATGNAQFTEGPVKGLRATRPFCT